MDRVLLLGPVILLTYSLIIPIIVDSYIPKKLDLDNSALTINGQAFLGDFKRILAGFDRSSGRC